MPKWRIADAHVDVLFRMVREGVPFARGVPGGSPSSDRPPSPPADETGQGGTLQAGAEALRQGGVALQLFALFAEPGRLDHEQFTFVLRMIDRFYQEVAKPHGPVWPVRTQEDLSAAAAAGITGGVLTLEGAGCLGGQAWLLRILHALGVRGMTLTWNPGNLLADGCAEQRDAGLTAAGKAVLREMSRLGMWLDLAHLGVRSTHEALSLFDGPVMVSHANVKSVYDHPRNLPDDVIREVFARQGWYGLTFETSFVAPGPSGVEQLFAHLDRLLELGGSDFVGFGSDFDGLHTPLTHLSCASDYQWFAEQLAARFGPGLARRLLYDNLAAFLQRALPNGATAPD
ncbi:MAG: membrane dipeptidase [Alicyclobacillaceae bacterium]|nr:membrane dipeptidase [Alicyclobacillaceae bacterium]